MADRQDPIGVGTGNLNTSVNVPLLRTRPNIYAYTTIQLTREQAKPATWC